MTLVRAVAVKNIKIVADVINNSKHGAAITFKQFTRCAARLLFGYFLKVTADVISNCGRNK